MSIFLTEASKSEHGCKNLPWAEISNLMNSEGPCIRTTQQWRKVSLEYLNQTKDYFILFSGSKIINIV